MGEVLRIVGKCSQPYEWYHNTENGTVWMSQGFYFFQLFKKTFPSCDIVTELSPSNVTLTEIQTIADGRADVDASYYGVTYARFALVDFSYPLYYDGIYIISTEKEKVSGDVFSGVFDDLSYAMFLVSYVLLALLLWVFLRSNATESLTKTLFYTATTFASAQPLPDSFLSRNGAKARSLSVFITCVALFANTMYGCVIMSKLMSRQETDTIDKIPDLLQKKFSDKRILMVQFSTEDDLLKSWAKIYNSLASRIEYYEDTTEPVFYEQLLEKVHSGSHVLIDWKENFFDKHSFMSEQMQCKIPRRNFRFSKDPLETIRVSWLYRKGYARSESIDLQLMWLASFGLINNLRKKEGGILSSKREEEDSCPETDWSVTDRVGCAGGTMEESQVPLGMIHLGKVFVALGVGLGLAMSSFIFELGWYKSKEVRTYIFTRNKTR